MTHVYLVRHGQAQTGAMDEASYDRLSPLGHDQARWLGDYLAGSGMSPVRIIAGGMRRQQETAHHIAGALEISVATDTRLDEIDYFGLADAMSRARGSAHPETRDEFLLHFPSVMAAWAAGEISCPGESFAGYEDRVQGALHDAETHDRTMLVTSGGIIGMSMRHILGLGIEPFSRVLLQTHNASFHHYQIEAGARRLVTFNATPQLDSAERSTARTFI